MAGVRDCPVAKAWERAFGGFFPKLEVCLGSSLVSGIKLIIEKM